MKKTIPLIALLLLTGCSTVTCKTTNSDNNIDIKYKINYKSDQINNVKLTKTYKFNTKEELENYNSIMTYTVKKDTTDNTKVTIKKKSKKYILTYDYNINNMNEQELKQAGLNKDKEELIKELKNNGFICK